MFRKLKVYSGGEHPHAGTAADRGGALAMSTNYIYGTGRRKTSIARVRLVPVTGASW